MSSLDFSNAGEGCHPGLRNLERKSCCDNDFSTIRGCAPMQTEWYNRSCSNLKRVERRSVVAGFRWWETSPPKRQVPLLAGTGRPGASGLVRPASPTASIEPAGPLAMSEPSGRDAGGGTTHLRAWPLGYEDLNDHDELAQGPGRFAVAGGQAEPGAADRLASQLAGKSTAQSPWSTRRGDMRRKYHKIDLRRCAGRWVAGGSFPRSA